MKSDKKIETLIMETFVGFDLRKHAPKFLVIVIYKNPGKQPNFMARLWNGEQITPYIVIADSLEDIRNKIPLHLCLMSRCPDDDPNIVETYI